MMPTTSPTVLPMPTPDVMFFDPKTGALTKEGYDFLKRIEVVLRKVRSEIP
jgi:hypothetical protein